MNYKSILTVWDGQDNSRSTLQRAIEFARENDGHLHVICPAFITIKTGGGYPFEAFPEAVDPIEVEEVSEKAERNSKQVHDILQKEDILHSVETAILNRDELPALMGHVARFSDLVVVPRPFGDGRSETDENILESALFSDQCPVFIVPPTPPVEPDSKAVIAWDGSQQALKAAKMALPLLEKSESVDVIVVAKSKNKNKETLIAEELGMFLSRHCIKVDIKLVPHSGGSMSDMILSHATTLNASLIVMGGYGHSPLREFLFGGATRDILKNCDVPILMAH